MVQVTPLSGIETGPKASPRTEVDLTSTRLLMRSASSTGSPPLPRAWRAPGRTEEMSQRCAILRGPSILVEVRQKVKSFFHPRLSPSFSPSFFPAFSAPFLITVKELTI